MINLLYCFDSNYNSMAFSSIISILDIIDEKINIYIIHNKENIIQEIPEYIQKHRNLNSVQTYKFNNETNAFPNVETSHVSEATYYRLFLEDYIDENPEYLIYLDADVVCLKNPIKYFKTKINEMEKNNKAIAVMTHPEVPDFDTRVIQLGINSGKYFNAGVMFINFSEWKKISIKNKSEKIIKEKSEDLILWDQDVLNIIFDGNFEDLDPLFNYRMNLLNFTKEESDIIEEEVYLIHYYGKSKPWSVRGINFGVSEYYQSQYRKFNKEKYHIVHNWKRGSIVYIFESIFTGKIFKIKYPFSFLYESIKSFFK